MDVELVCEFRSLPPRPKEPPLAVVRFVDARGRPVVGGVRIWAPNPYGYMETVCLLVEARAEFHDLHFVAEIVAGARDADGRPLGPAVIDAVPAGESVLTLLPGRTLEGRILDSDGRPVHGARVALAPRIGGVEYATQTMTRTDPEGRFVLEGLGAFAYELEVNVPPGQAKPAPIAISPTRREVTIRLERRGRTSARPGE
jgi:hypothetical protein